MQDFHGKFDSPSLFLPNHPMKRIPASLAKDLETDADVDLTRLMRFVSHSYGIGNVDLARRYYAYCDINLGLRTEYKRYFLKLHKTEQPARLKIVADKINMLSEHGLPVARVHSDLKGQLVTVFNGKACLLQDYAHKGQIDHMHFTKSSTENMGSTLALLNKIGTAHDQDNQKGLSLESGWSMDRFDKVLADAEANRHLLPADIRVIIKKLEREWNKAKPFLAEAKRGFVHNDFHLGNIKMKDGKVSAIFDFSDASYSWHAADVGIALQYIFMPYKADRHHIKNFIKGYQSVNPLPEQDLKLIPLFMRMRSATRVICTLTELGHVGAYGVALMRKLDRPDVRKDILRLTHP